MTAAFIGNPETTSGSFAVELPQFSGPLDLLLSLIREEQVDIYDIPIARIAQQLVERLAAVDRVLRAVSRPDMHDVVPRALDVPAAIDAIRAVLALRAHALLTDILLSGHEPWQVLSMLLGLLELARVGELQVRQL